MPLTEGGWTLHHGAVLSRIAAQFRFVISLLATSEPVKPTTACLSFSRHAPLDFLRPTRQVITSKSPKRGMIEEKRRGPQPTSLSKAMCFGRPGSNLTESISPLWYFLMSTLAARCAVIERPSASNVSLHPPIQSVGSSLSIATAGSPCRKSPMSWIAGIRKIHVPRTIIDRPTSSVIPGRFEGMKLSLTYSLTLSKSPNLE